MSTLVSKLKLISFVLVSKEFAIEKKPIIRNDFVVNYSKYSGQEKTFNVITFNVIRDAATGKSEINYVQS